MSSGKSYVPPFNLNEPIQSGLIAEVTESRNSDFKAGDFLSARLDWKESQV